MRLCVVASIAARPDKVMPASSIANLMGPVNRITLFDDDDDDDAKDFTRPMKEVTSARRLETPRKGGEKDRPCIEQQAMETARQSDNESTDTTISNDRRRKERIRQRGVGEIGGWRIERT